MDNSLVDERYYNIYKPLRDMYIEGFKNTNSGKNKKLIKCAVCGDINYVCEDEVDAYYKKIENSDMWVCTECLSGEILSYEESLALDRELGLADDVDIDERYIEPGRVYAKRGIFSFDELKRNQKQSTLLLRDFLLENDVDTYNKYKELLEGTIKSYERFNV